MKQEIDIQKIKSIDSEELILSQQTASNINTIKSILIFWHWVAIIIFFVVLATANAYATEQSQHNDIQIINAKNLKSSEKKLQRNLYYKR